MTRRCVEPPAALLSLALLVSLAAGGCGADRAGAPGVAPADSAAVTDRTPDQRLYHARITDTRADRVRWVLESDRLDRYAGDDVAQLHGVVMRFFRADTLFSTLTARRGTANLKTKEMHAWGDVVVVTTDGRRLETSELTYDNDRGLIYNDVYDRFTRGDDVLTGWGMEASPDLSYFELKREVAAEVAPADSAGAEE